MYNLTLKAFELIINPKYLYLKESKITEFRAKFRKNQDDLMKLVSDQVINMSLLLTIYVNLLKFI